MERPEIGRDGRADAGRHHCSALAPKVSMEVDAPGCQHEANGHPCEYARVAFPKGSNDAALSNHLPGEQKQPREEGHREWDSGKVLP